MKFLKIVSITLLLLITSGVALPFILPQNTYKKWMIAEVERSLPVRLEIGSFRLVFLPFPSIRLEGVKVHAVRTGKEPLRMAEAESVWVSVALNPLFRRRVQASLHLQKPFVDLREVLALPVVKGREKGKTTSWQFEIVSFDLDDGQIQNGRIPLEHVDFSLKGLGFTGLSKVPFFLAMGLLGGEKNLQLKGNLKLDADRQKWVGDNLQLTLGMVHARLKGNFDAQAMSAGLDLQADAGQIDAATLKDHFPGIFSKLLRMPEGEMPVLRDVTVQSRLQWNEEKGLRLDGRMRSKSLAYKDYLFENVETRYDFVPPRLEIHPLTATLFGSQSVVTGDVDLGQPLAYRFDVQTDQIDLSRLPFLKGVLVGRGKLTAKLDGRMTEKQDPVRSLNADGQIEVTEGKIPTLKLGEEIFGHSVWGILKPLAGFNRAALDALKKLDANVEKLDIPFEVRGGVARILNGEWENPRYLIHVDGGIAMNLALSGGGSFALAQKETADLIPSAAVRKILANAEGQMVLPFSIGGLLTAPKVTPDKQELTSRFSRAVAARGIEFLKDQLNPEKVAEEPVKVLETPVKVFEDIFGK